MGTDGLIYSAMPFSGSYCRFFCWQRNEILSLTFVIVKITAWSSGYHQCPTGLYSTWADVAFPHPYQT